MEKGKSYLHWKRGVIAAFMAVLIFPLVQEWTGIITERPLSGVEEIPSEVPLTWITWTDGSFQENYAHRSLGRMGFRSPLVRMGNQLDYDLFGLLFDNTHAGKDGELFRHSSFRAVTGRDAIPDEQIAYHSNHITYLQQYLSQRNIWFLPVLTPSKLRCMPSSLENEDLDPVRKTNYQRYLDAFNEYGLSYLDLTGELTRSVAEGGDRVFPKTGSHWTDHGAVMGFQQILRFMEAVDRKPYANFMVKGYERSNIMRGTDADAGDILNLLRDFPADTVAYPVLVFEERRPENRPKVLVISDSFWWKIYDQGLHDNVFAPGSQFRYYNWEVWSDAWEDSRTADQFDLRKSIEEVEWVILCANEANLHKFPFGFADQALEAYGLFKSEK